MDEFFQNLFSNEFLAVAVPGMVFAITVFLLFRRLITFMVTLVLLGFAVISGFAFLHHEDVAAYLRGEVDQARVDDFKQDLVDFKDQVMKAVNDLRKDLDQPDQLGHDAGLSQLPLEEIQARFARLEEVLLSGAHENPVSDLNAAESDTGITGSDPVE